MATINIADIIKKLQAGQDQANAANEARYQTVADQASWVDVTTGIDLVDRTDLNTKVQAIRDKLQAVIDVLQSYGLM